MKLERLEKFIDDLTEKVNKLEHVNHYDMELFPEIECPKCNEEFEEVIFFRGINTELDGVVDDIVKLLDDLKSEIDIIKINQRRSKENED